MLLFADLKLGGGAVHNHGIHLLLCAPCTCVTHRKNHAVFFGEKEGLFCSSLFNSNAQYLSFTPPPKVVRAFFTPHALCALSQDSDNVYLLDKQNGTPFLCQKAGIFPRDMAHNASFSHLAVAGGTDGNVYVLHALTLQIENVFHYDAQCVSVCFFNDTLYALYQTDTGYVLLKCAHTFFIKGKEHPLTMCVHKNFLLLCTQNTLTSISKKDTFKTQKAGFFVRAFSHSASNTVYLLEASEGKIYTLKNGQFSPLPYLLQDPQDLVVL